MTRHDTPRRIAAVLLAVALVVSMPAAFVHLGVVTEEEAQSVSPVGKTEGAPTTADLTTFVETDPNGKATIDNSTHLSISGVTSNDDAPVVYKDIGNGYQGLEIKYSFEISSYSSNALYGLGLASSGNRSLIDTDSKQVQSDMPVVLMDSGLQGIQLRDRDDNNAQAVAASSISTNTRYFVTTRYDRDAAQVTLEVFSDSERTSSLGSSTMGFNVTSDNKFLYAGLPADRDFGTPGSMDISISDLRYERFTDVPTQGSPIDATTMASSGKFSAASDHEIVVTNQGGNDGGYILGSGPSETENAVLKFEYLQTEHVDNGGTAIGFGKADGDRLENNNLAGVRVISDTRWLNKKYGNQRLESGTGISVSTDTNYYFTIKLLRNESTVDISIYSDQARTNLLHSSSAFIAEEADYDRVGVFGLDQSFGTSGKQSLSIRNLRVSTEAAPVADGNFDDLTTYTNDNTSLYTVQDSDLATGSNTRVNISIRNQDNDGFYTTHTTSPGDAKLHFGFTVYGTGDPTHWTTGWSSNNSYSSHSEAQFLGADIGDLGVSDNRHVQAHFQENGGAGSSNSGGSVGIEEGTYHATLYRNDTHGRVEVYESPLRNTIVYNSSVSVTDITFNYTSIVFPEGKSTDGARTNGAIEYVQQGGTAPTTALPGGSGNTVSGTVVNQNGDPVRNATVQVWGVDFDQITPPAGVSKQEEAINELQDALNKTPSDWVTQQNDGFNLLGSTGHFQEVDGTYAAVHHVTDWKRSKLSNQLRQDPDLDDPMLEVPSARGGTVTVAVSIWDPSKESAIENNVDSQLPGKPATGRITVETLFARDTAFETTTQRVRFDPDRNPLGNFIATNEEYDEAFAVMDLTPGYYRVYPEGNQASSYVIKVGDPMEFIAEDLESQKSQVATQAQLVTNKLNGGTFTKTTTTTDSDGEWSVSTGSTVNTVEVQAYKAPDVSVNDTDLSAAEIIDTYRDAGPNELKDLGAVYFPSETRRVSPPETGVEIEMAELSYSPYADPSKLTDKLEDDLWAQLNETLKDGIVQDRLANKTREDIQELHDQMQDLVDQNDELRDRLEDAIEDRQGEDTNVEVVIDDSTDESREELENRIADMEDAINELEESIEAGTPSSELGQDTISLSFPFDADLGSQNVMVLAHYSNGTTKSMNTSSQYVSIEDSLVGGDVVRVTDFPLGGDDAAAVNFEVLVSTPDGIGSASEAAINPTFDNDVPSLESISVSTMAPTAGDKVSIEVHPEDSSTFGEITKLRVIGPDGNGINSDNITSNGRETGFNARGAGTHHVEVSFNNTAGDVFTETFRLTGSERDRARSPSVRPMSGTTGTYALVSDGLDRGSVSTNADGSAIEMVAAVADGDDSPGTVHFYTDGLETAPDTQYTLRIVEGGNDRSVQSQVGTVLHSPGIDSETPVLERQGEAIPREGENRFALVQRRTNGTVIRTFTASDGSVNLRVNNDPSFVERALYRVDLATQDLPFVGAAIFPPLLDGSTWYPPEVVLP